MRPDVKEALKASNFHSDGTPLAGVEVMQRVKDAQQHNKILLSFSCGKDSIGAWLALRDAGFEVTPFYMQYVPGLQFVEKSLRYYEKFFNTHIFRMIHPAFYRWLYHYVFVDPPRAEWITLYRDQALIFGNMEQAPVYDLISELVRQEAGLPEGTFTATGVRAADSPNRRSAVNQHGAINWSRRYCWPIWDVRKDPLIDLLNQYGCKLPIDYKWFGRSLDGLDYRFMYVLKREAPEDFRRVLEFFPFVEAELFRYEL